MSNNQLAGLFNLEGQTALITGSTRGIGFALARGLGQAGAHMCLLMDVLQIQSRRLWMN